MTDPHNLSKNRGEWAEIVAIFRCLQSGRIQTVRSTTSGLIPTNSAISISEIRLERSGKAVAFKFNRAGGARNFLSVYIDGCLIIQLSRTDVETDSRKLLDAIESQAASHRVGNFSVPEIGDLIQKYQLGSGKTKSSLKQDLEMILLDPDSIPLSPQGFSVKSFVGADPTVFNASRAARFKFRLDGAKVNQALAIEAQIKSSKPKSWVKELFGQLNSIGAFTQTIEIPDRRFERNLELLDTHMPTVMGAMLLKAFCSGDMSVSECLKRVIISDPLGYGGDSEIFYSYRVKHFLRAAALGFSSSKPWNGNEGADGGMLFVNKDWQLFCMLSNRKDFEEYLVRSCRFESPSSSLEKHGGYGKIEKEWHGTYVDLLLQIRESNPFKQ